MSIVRSLTLAALAAALLAAPQRAGADTYFSSSASVTLGFDGGQSTNWDSVSYYSGSAAYGYQFQGAAYGYLYDYDSYDTSQAPIYYANAQSQTYGGTYTGKQSLATTNIQRDNVGLAVDFTAPGTAVLDLSWALSAYAYAQGRHGDYAYSYNSFSFSADGVNLTSGYDFAYAYNGTYSDTWDSGIPNVTVTITTPGLHYFNIDYAFSYGDATSAPEPASVAMAGLGVVGLAAFRRRKAA